MVAHIDQTPVLDLQYLSTGLDLLILTLLSHSAGSAGLIASTTPNIKYELSQRVILYPYTDAPPPVKIALF